VVTHSWHSAGLSHANGVWTQPEGTTHSAVKQLLVGTHVTGAVSQVPSTQVDVVQASGGTQGWVSSHATILIFKLEASQLHNCTYF